ncbi:MAG: Fic family protein [Enhydrobacter sp.]|nr:Fic family protein [Enhydrobacter sp.]
MAKFMLSTAPEVFVSTAAMSSAVSRAVAAGQLRKLGSRLYTTNLREAAETLVRRHLWEIAAGYFPDALVADRTALEMRPAEDGSIFLVSASGSRVVLPGVTLRARRGIGPLDGDFKMRDRLYCMSPARAVLENMRPSRARSGAAATLRPETLEGYLERRLRDSGEEQFNALRDQAKALAPQLGLEAEAGKLDALMGALLGTRDAPLKSPAGRARARGFPFDDRRIALFEALGDALRSFAPEASRPWAPKGNAAINQAFFEAYFSNFIEGTEFTVDEARAIVFEGAASERPRDAHDVLGAFKIVADPAEMRRLPASPDAFLDMLRTRHRILMEGRPEVGPGVFKTRSNQFGAHVFVAPDQVAGTLTEAFPIYQRLSEPLHRAIFMMFLVSEVHPFADGNGRVARIMMNAELAATDQVRVLIPIVYRNNYLTALRALSTNAHAEPIIKTLVFAQRYAAAIPWQEFTSAVVALKATHAFVRPEDGDEQGIRLRIPSAADLAGQG